MYKMTYIHCAIVYTCKRLEKHCLLMRNWLNISPEHMYIDYHLIRRWVTEVAPREGKWKTKQKWYEDLFLL